jgi:hypothetical protein
MAVGRIRRRPEKAVRTLNVKTLSDRLVAATAGANRRTTCFLSLATSPESFQGQLRCLICFSPITLLVVCRAVFLQRYYQI